VTFTVTCEAASYRWDFGDGGAAEGPTADHTYAKGSFTAVLTATLPDATTVRQELRIDAFALTLSAPRRGEFGRPVTLRGRLDPVPAGVVRPAIRLYRAGRLLGTSPAAAGGAFRLRTRLVAPGPYRARFADASSAPVSVLVRPRIGTTLLGSGAVGDRLALAVRVRPAGAGAVRVRIWRDGRPRADVTYRRPARISLETRRPALYRIHIRVVPAAGFATTSRTLALRVALPRLAPGSFGDSVLRLRGQLAALGYAVPPPSRVFDGALLDSVYAFQKVERLPRTGVTDVATWRALARARRPWPRSTAAGYHLEIDKSRQVLFVVQDGRVTSVIPVSTAGLPGTFTPEGTFAVYRKVLGFDPSPLGVLYDPLYFTGGYAIHGNPSVPPYPASHGCVRVPMWLAASLYAATPYGTTVVVY
jgi:peptidoglycan hydrolase-like protein with peptidoglycan-binding domain